MEVKLIYFWKDGEFITNEYTNMMMMILSTAAVACCKGKAAETEEVQL